MTAGLASAASCLLIQLWGALQAAGQATARRLQTSYSGRGCGELQAAGQAGYRGPSPPSLAKRSSRRRFFSPMWNSESVLARASS